jgi:hypothetical protein
MKAHSTGGTRVHWARRAITTGTAIVLTMGAIAAGAREFGPGRGGPFDQIDRSWTYGLGNGAGEGSAERFGELGTSSLARQSRFYEPGQHRASGLGQAPSVSPGHYVHGPGAGGRGH